MHTIDIPDKNKTLQIPDSWDDCTQQQVHFILENAFDVMQGYCSIADFRVKVFLYLTGFKVNFWYMLRQHLGLNKKANEQIYRLSHNLCDWIFTKTETGAYELNYETPTNHFPKLSDHFHGPDDLLGDLTIGEFKSALEVLNLYFDSKSNPDEAMLHLQYFLAILYRPKDANGQKLPFHNYVIDPQPFNEVPLWQKQCIVIWFSFCVHCLQQADITINSIEVNLSSLFPTNSGSADPRTVNFGWTGVVMDIAETGVFGDAKETSQTSLYEILIYLLKKELDHKKASKK